MSVSVMEAPSEQLDLIVVDENTVKLKVAKSNALVEASYDLSAKEHKLLLIAMAEIRKDQTSFYEQVFSVQDLAELLDFSRSSAYSELDRISSGLMRKQVEIRDDDTGEWTKYQWVTKAYCRNGQFGIRFNDELKPYLLGLVGHFTMYELARALKMPSNYAIRLYELLKQYEGFGQRTFSLDPKATAKESWKSFPKVMGYDPKSYPRFSNLNQRVLTPAITQVKELTDIKVLEYRVIRFNRKPVALAFTWKTCDTLENIEDHPLYPEILGLGVSDKAIRLIFRDYDENHIARNLYYTKKEHKADRVKNPGAYLSAALLHDYAGKQQNQKPVDIEDTRALAEKATAAGDSDKRSAKPGTTTNGGAVLPPSRQKMKDDCANENEWLRLLSLEARLGVTFETYNDFVLQENALKR